MQANKRHIQIGNAGFVLLTVLLSIAVVLIGVSAEF